MYKVIKDKCDGCGTCVDVCPSGAIKIEDDVAVINYDECTECGTCQMECEKEAIIEVEVEDEE